MEKVLSRLEKHCIEDLTEERLSIRKKLWAFAVFLIGVKKIPPHRRLYDDICYDDFTALRRQILVWETGEEQKGLLQIFHDLNDEFVALWN